MVDSRGSALSVAGTVPAGRLGQFSWALFDWANQPFFTLITTFIFAPYFTSVVVGDPIHGQAVWGYTQSVAGALIAVFSPIFGSMADAAGPRKPWILFFQALCVIACFVLWFALPGAPGGIFPILAVIVAATVAAEFSIVFNNAMLPGLTREDRMGRLSGNAWALGYLGGLVSLIFFLIAFNLPDQPLFGLDRTTHEHDRVVGPLTAVWIIVFVIPFFLFTPDAPRSGLKRFRAAKQGLRQLRATVRKLDQFRNMGLFLIAHMIYFDGLSAIFAFGGIYAKGIFGWDTLSLGVFGIILTIFAAIGAFLGGWVDDRLGSKRTILMAIIGILVATTGVVSISVDGSDPGLRRDTLFFFLTVETPVAQNPPLFGTLAEQVFLGFGIMLGIFGGPMQAASRTMVSRLAPPSMVGEFYGLYALSGKATAFLAPLAIAIVTDAFASQRAGIATILVFLAVGFILLLPVREERAAAVH